MQQPNKNKIGQIIAQAISVSLHPTFIPILTCVLWYNVYPQHFIDYPTKKLNGLWGMMLINTILFPIVLVLLLKGLGFIKSFLMHESKERMIPLIGTMIFYFWPYLVAKNLEVPLAARSLLLGNFWGVVLLFVGTLFSKISMHSTGIGSLLGFFIVLAFNEQSILVLPLAVALIGSLAIIWARKFLNAHSLQELLIGLLIGVATQIGAHYYLY